MTINQSCNITKTYTHAESALQQSLLLSSLFFWFKIVFLFYFVHMQLMNVYLNMAGCGEYIHHLTTVNRNRQIVFHRICRFLPLLCIFHCYSLHSTPLQSARMGFCGNTRRKKHPPITSSTNFNEMHKKLVENEEPTSKEIVSFADQQSIMCIVQSYLEHSIFLVDDYDSVEYIWLYVRYFCFIIFSLPFPVSTTPPPPPHPHTPFHRSYFFFVIAVEHLNYYSSRSRFLRLSFNWLLYSWQFCLCLRYFHTSFKCVYHRIK